MKMILSWLALLLLHRGYALIPVTTAQLGEPVTLTCLFSNLEYSVARVKWYKQSVGDALKLITTLLKSTQSSTFEQGFPTSRFNVNHTSMMSTLTIVKTVQEDEAIYHCGVTTWTVDEWSGTYLFVKGNIQRTSGYTVVQWPPVSDPVHPGDSVTLQCSVLADSDQKACPGEHSVHWFGVRSDKSFGNVMYVNSRNGSDESLTAKGRCVYHFSKKVVSSDAGMYYCAVAMCGEIIFGNGTKLDIEGTSLWSFDAVNMQNIIISLLGTVLAISVIVIALLVYIIKNTNNTVDLSVQETKIAKRDLKREGDPWVYSAAVFTLMTTSINGKRSPQTVDREKIYAAARAFGLDQ